MVIGKSDCRVVVADGHDYDGSIIARWAVESFMADPPLGKVILTEEEIRDRVAMVHQMVGYLGMKGGTTITMAEVGGDEIRVAWLGDSEARVVKENGHLATLTIPHLYGLHRGETARLKSQGAVIVASSGGGAGAGEIRRGAIVKDKAWIWPTRVLGDGRFDPWIIHEPEFRSYLLTSEDRFLIVATDGFWGVVARRGRTRHRLEALLAGAADVREVREKITSFISRKRIPDNLTVVILGWQTE
ncbi:protein serine/threonine phosphatase 2C family protein [Candidatus Uhrbacteria bacterium]|nr:protein serine/threonine phosphatase 2C family protein [Candidatus Uhrbacteria bacterium]